VTVRRPPPPPVYTQAQRDDYEERAAILEFEAGMTREEAERWAAHWCLGIPLAQIRLW
jgi:hypothetical protein